MSDAADLLMFHPAGHWSVQRRLTSQGWVRLRSPSAPRQPPVGFNFDHGRDQVETAPFSGDSLMCRHQFHTRFSRSRLGSDKQSTLPCSSHTGGGDLP